MSGEVDGNEAMKQRFYLDYIFNILFKCLCIYVFGGVGEESLYFDLILTSDSVTSQYEETML